MNPLRRCVRFARKHPFQAVFLGALVVRMIAYGGSKPDTPEPPVVVEEGITITERTVDSDGITIKWKSEDSRIVPGETVFIIEARERPMRLGKTIVMQPTNPDWYEIGRTTDFELAQPGVWTDKTREIRVRTVIEGVAE